MPFKKGQSGNMEGRPKGSLSSKRQEWEQMGETLVGTWTDYVMQVGNDMIEEGKFEEFYPLYKDMVNYFKPKLSSAQLEAKADINIQVKEPDWAQDGD